jgi:hypothetical protein
VLCLQPAVVRAAEFCKWSKFDHGIFLRLSVCEAPGATRPAS